MSSSHTKEAHEQRKKSREKGEAELMFFGVIVIICGIISGTLFILNWVKDSKNAKVEAHQYARMYRMTPTPFSSRPDPAAYLATCNKQPWQVLQTTVPCEVMPESYGEIYLAPIPD
jgi:hypothetical protein